MIPFRAGAQIDRTLAHPANTTEDPAEAGAALRS